MVSAWTKRFIRAVQFVHTIDSNVIKSPRINSLPIPRVFCKLQKDKIMIVFGWVQVHTHCHCGFMWSAKLALTFKDAVLSAKHQWLFALNGRVGTSMFIKKKSLRVSVGHFLCCWWKYKQIQPFQREIWQYLRNCCLQTAIFAVLGQKIFRLCIL